MAARSSSYPTVTQLVLAGQVPANVVIRNAGDSSEIKSPPPSSSQEARPPGSAASAAMAGHAEAFSMVPPEARLQELIDE
jgi:hypothetical protein